MTTAARRRGFSLVELLVVVAILLVIAAMATPAFMNIIATTRLRASVGGLSGLLQNCRMVAVKTNRTMTVHFTAIAAGPVAYIKPAGDLSPISADDPQVQFGAPISKVTVPSGTGAPSELDPAVLGFTPITPDPAFNARGLPCNYSSTACTGNVGFAYYFRDSRTMNSNGWAALSITPAGRVKTWYWNGFQWRD